MFPAYFVHDDTRITNPHWSACGRFPVDPATEYGQAGMAFRTAHPDHEGLRDDPGATVPATPFERGQYYVQTFALADVAPDYDALDIPAALQRLADQDDAYELGTHTYTELDAAEFLRGVRAALGAP